MKLRRKNNKHTQKHVQHDCCSIIFIFYLISGCSCELVPDTSSHENVSTDSIDVFFC